MELLENYPLLHQWLKVAGLTVFHTLWSGCLLLLLLIVLLKIIPAPRARVRFAVSWVVLQFLLLLFVAIFFQQWKDAAIPAEPSISVALRSEPTEEVLRSSESTTIEQTASLNPAVSWLTILNRWAPVGAALWLLGGVFHFVRLVGGLQHTQRFRTHSQPLPDDWRRRLSGLKQSLGVDKDVAFLLSHQTSVPLTFGWLRPVVLIPASLLTLLSPDQVEMIVLHELAHIRRHDYLWSLGQSVAEVVLFYHPAYWYIARVLEREREFACDQMTVQVTQQPEAYARTLVDIASTNVTSFGLAASNKRGLSARIRRVVEPVNSSKSGSMLTVFLLLGAVGLVLLTATLYGQDRPDMVEQPGEATGKNWLYILNGQVQTTRPAFLDQDHMKDQWETRVIPGAESWISQYLTRAQRASVEEGQYDSILFMISKELLLEDSLKGRNSWQYPQNTNPPASPTPSNRIKKGQSKLGSSVPPHSLSAYQQNLSEPTDRWLYIVDGQVQTSRPALLDQDSWKDERETRVIPNVGSQVKGYPTEAQQAQVSENEYTGILFIMSKEYAAGQQGSYLIHGTATEVRSERPVPGIEVWVKGKDMSTITDANGNYQLFATSEQDTIEFLQKNYPPKIPIAAVPINGKIEVSVYTYNAIMNKESRKKMQKTLENIERRVQLRSNMEKLPTRPSEDSSAINALSIVDGTPQPNKTSWKDLSLKDQDIQSVEVLTYRDGAYQYYRTPASFIRGNDGFEVKKEDIPPTISAQQQREWQAEGHDKVVLVQTKKGIAALDVVNLSKRKSPEQDSIVENTLVVVDGVPQYGKTLEKVGRELEKNQLYSHHTLTSFGVDSSRAILRLLQAKGYNRVVSIDSWANLKKDGRINPTRLEEFLQVFPNPTQDWFTLQFFIGEELPITLTILDDQGKRLAILTDQTYPAGSHEVGWDASEQKPGVYYVQWTMGRQHVTRKVVIE